MFKNEVGTVIQLELFNKTKAVLLDTAHQKALFSKSYNFVFDKRTDRKSVV